MCIRDSGYTTEELEKVMTKSLEPTGLILLVTACGGVLRYMPVSYTHLAVGMLMIPKTCAYVWTVMIGYQAMRKTAR